jgi:hypothetical protein
VAAVTATMFLGANGTASAVPSIDPPSLDFGSQSVSTTSAPHYFTLSAYCTVQDPTIPTLCGGGDFLTTSIVASGPFVVQAENCPDVLFPVLFYSPATCTIQVAFQPAAGGPATGILSTGGPTAELRGTGVGGSTQPSNQFTFGKLKLNRTNGTATLPIVVPGPGTLALGGKGVVSQRPAERPATLGRIVSAAGRVKLAIKPKGRAKAELKRTGRATVKAKVTFTPSGGAPASRTRKIRLLKNL